MRLWYKKPAENWNEALPVGNGMIGGMIFGRTDQEIIQLNEESIWSGSPVDRHNPDARENLGNIRRLLRNGKIREAEQLCLYALSGTPDSQRAYQTAGELYLTDLNKGNIAGYCRELLLDSAQSRVTFRRNDTDYIRTVFVSYPDNVMVIHMEAKGQATLNFDCCLQRMRCYEDKSGRENQNTIFFEAGTGEAGIHFCVMLCAQECDGTVRTVGDHLLIREAHKVTLYLTISTGFRCKNPHEQCEKQLKDAEIKGFERIKDSHVEDYRQLFEAFQISVGQGDREDLPTDQRLERLSEQDDDEGIFALYAQYGRYLLIASSREGGLPCTLQGIWNDSLTPPWESKYTININTEMNYWHAESMNLSSCHLPFFEHLERMKENGKITAQKMYGCKGTVAHHNTDIHADTAPQDQYIPATYWVCGQAWMCTHIWEHYLYTQDEDFLEKYFDVYEENVRFFYDFLIEAEDGTLVTSPSISPENTYIMKDGSRGCLCEGSYMDTEILRELFKGYIGACRVLKKDSILIEKAEAVVSKLPPYKIGRYGQLQEWREDYEEAEPGHRHVAHLYGVYPGTTLNWNETPEYMAAAKKSLERRLFYGGGHTGWSRAWIVGLWARFLEGDKAHENLIRLLKDSTFINLMDNHPADENRKIFQIDGNMGAAAAILEMLVQCHDGVIRLLPALPQAWSCGKISGACIRGGITLNMEWQDRKVVHAELYSSVTQNVKLLVNGDNICQNLKAGEMYIFTGLSRTE